MITYTCNGIIWTVMILLRQPSGRIHKLEGFSNWNDSNAPRLIYSPIVRLQIFRNLFLVCILWFWLEGLSAIDSQAVVQPTKNHCNVCTYCNGVEAIGSRSFLGPRHANSSDTSKSIRSIPVCFILCCTTDRYTCHTVLHHRSLELAYR